MRFSFVSLLVASTAARSSLRVRGLGGLNVTDATKHVFNTGNTNDLSNVENFENVDSSDGLKSVGNARIADTTQNAEAVEGVGAGQVSLMNPKIGKPD